MVEGGKIKNIMKNKTTKQQKEEILAKIFSLIREKPGIRPRELNLRLNRKHSASLRDSLIKRGLVRKERKGSAVHYYPRKNP